MNLVPAVSGAKARLALSARSESNLAQVAKGGQRLPPRGEITPPTLLNL